jgi:hypothetical protein
MISWAGVLDPLGFGVSSGMGGLLQMKRDVVEVLQNLLDVSCWNLLKEFVDDVSQEGFAAHPEFPCPFRRDLCIDAADAEVHACVRTDGRVESERVAAGREDLQDHHADGPEGSPRLRLEVVQGRYRGYRKVQPDGVPEPIIS